MIEKIKTWWKKLRCSHINSELIRWHLVHIPNYEPLSVEAEYLCRDCGELSYLYLKGVDKEEWVRCMGNYKKEH